VNGESATVTLEFRPDNKLDGRYVAKFGGRIGGTGVKGKKAAEAVNADSYLF